MSDVAIGGGFAYLAGMIGDDDLESLLSATARRSAAYLNGLATRPAGVSTEAVTALRKAVDEPLPEGPTPADAVLALMDDYGAGATVASAGGRYFGYVTGGSLPAALAANWLATAWDQNAFSSISAPGAAVFEDVALSWLKDVLGLPAECAGALVGGATMANFSGLAAARHRLLDDAGWDVERQGLFGAPDITVVVGAEAHAALFKALAMLGLGRDRVITVPADDQGRMRADALPPLSGPTIVCLQAGNVNSGAFDPAPEIIAWAKEGQTWVHVDGAFGLWARAADDLAELAAGYEDADSWATDAHKWLNVPYDSGVVLVRDGEALNRAMTVSGAYLEAGADRDPIDFTPACSRRARGIDVWAALKSLGRAGVAEMVTRHCRQAQAMAEGLTQGGIEVLNDVVLNQVVVSFGDEEQTRLAIKSIQDGGVCWCGGTTWRGRPAMRISVSSWMTTDEDIARSCSAIVAASRAVDGAEARAHG